MLSSCDSTDKALTLKRILVKAYTIEFLRVSGNWEYVKSICSGCLYERSSQREHLVCCVDSPRDKVAYCLDDLIDKTNYVNISNTLQELAEELDIDTFNEVPPLFDTIWRSYLFHNNIIKYTWRSSVLDCDEGLG